MMDDSGMISMNDTAGKYIFWDIDGTLAAYRFNNHVADPCGTDNGMSVTEIEEGIFLKRKPSKFMQNIVNACNARSNIIMGHSQIQKEIDDKQIWLDEHYPNITERLFTFEDKPKYETILTYCLEQNISLGDVMYVDDIIPFLREAERHGIPSYHISSFLDWFVL